MSAQTSQVPGIITPTCPACGAVVKTDDINVARGLMLCRACGRVALVGAGSPQTSSDATGELESPPPKPRRLQTHIADGDGILELRRRTGSISVSLFLLFWLTGWTVGCVMIVHQAITQPGFITFFAVPFVASWFFVAGLLLDMWFGRELLVLSGEGVWYERWTLIRWRQQYARVVEVRDVREFAGPSRSENGPPQHGIRIVGTEGELKFGGGLPDEERVWLMHLIRQRLWSAGAGGGAPHNATTARAGGLVQPPGAGATAIRGTTRVEELTPDAAVEAPRESELSITDGPDDVTITHPVAGIGAWRLSGLPGLAAATFVNVFWNSIVGVFLYELVQHFQWFLFFFLIPFEAIGLAIFGAWLALLFSPATSVQWTVSTDAGLAVWRLFGVPVWRRIHALGPLARLEARCGSAPLGGDEKWTLVLVGADQRDLLEIGGLTYAETRWLGQALFAFFARLRRPIGC